MGCQSNERDNKICVVRGLYNSQNEMHSSVCLVPIDLQECSRGKTG